MQVARARARLFAASAALGCFTQPACHADHVAPPAPSSADALPECPGARQVAWRGTFEPGWLASWDPNARILYGERNAEVVSEPRFGSILRVHYPAGSSSVAYAREASKPVGGLEFKVPIPPLESLDFAYFVRFAPNFPWVKGGKLPGVCGGTCPSGGKIVTGYDGWSMRLMWRPEGQGEEYAYILPPQEYGTELGRGTWTFQTGDWHRVIVEIVLNKGGAANGTSRVWYDADPGGPPTFEAKGLTFRLDRTPADTLFFSTFFGGHDETWATPVDTYADFARFVVCR